jgi:C-terminal processing protease CtpA/Prc
VPAAAAVAAGALILGLTIAQLAGCAGSPAESGDRNPARGPEAASLRDDIEVFAEELPRRHKELFFQLEEEEYRRRLRQLEEQLPRLSEAEVEIELRRLLSDVGDSHTDLMPRMEQVYPLRFTRFQEGMFLRQADTAYAEMVGMELTAVDGTPLTEVRRRIAEIVPNENEMQLWIKVSMYLSLPYYLKALGIVEGETASFALRDGEGNRHVMKVRAITRSAGIDWHRYLGGELPIPQDPADIPLYMKGQGTVYRMEYRESERLLYIQYNSCREMEDYPFETFTEDVVQRIESVPVEKLVVDLRFNGGGDSRVFRPLLQELERDYKGGRDYDLFAVIGRDTYSSAILNAVDLKKKAGAVLVGEPTAGKPNHYGEIKRLELPYSGLQLSYSTKYFDIIDEDINTLVPDLQAVWSFRDFSEWKDGAMEVIRGY